MSSFARRSREEVAVNIAVTGFVARLLPTQTKDLSQSLEALNEQVRKNREGIRSRERELKTFRAADDPERAERLNREINELNDSSKKYTQTIKELRVELREKQAAIGDSLQRIRGWGIVLGVAALALGGLSAAVVKVAGDMREWETLAFRTGTTTAALRQETQRLQVVLGDSQAARSAVESLAEIHHQIRLVQYGMGNFIGQFSNLARAGIDPAQFFGLSPEAIQQRLVQLLKNAGDNPAVREALRATFGPAFDAAVSEMQLDEADFKVPDPLSDSQLEILRQARRNFGAMQVSAGRMAEIFTVAVTPAISKYMGVLNSGIGWIRGFAEEHETAAKSLGGMAVTGGVVLGIFAAINVAWYTGKITLQSLIITQKVWTKLTAGPYCHCQLL